MKLEELKYFYEVCRHKSFNQASQELYISRQALVRSINNLKNELNRQLFSRSPFGVELTEFGELFYQRALATMNQLDSLYNLPFEFDRREKEHITFGIRGNFRSAYAINKLIDRFTKEYPYIHVEIINCEVVEIESFVESGRMDLGFTICPPSSKSLNYLTIETLEEVLLLYKDHPLSSQDKITADMLKDEAIMLASFSDHPMQNFQKFMQNAGLEANVVFATVDLGLLYHVVSTREALGLLLRRDAELGSQVSADLVIRELSPPLLLKLGLIFRKDMHFTKAQKLFLDYLHQNYNNNTI